MRSEEKVERQGLGLGLLMAFGGRTSRGVREGQGGKREALRASVVLGSRVNKDAATVGDRSLGLDVVG